MKESIFTKVKQIVTTRSAAAFYGIQTNRRGMARCPFHDDHTPSMILDQNYYCFGCQAKGDVIDFVSKLFGISLIEAVRKLIRDMNLPVAEDTKKDSIKQKTGCREIPNQNAGKQLQELEEYYYTVLIRYRNRLLEQKNRYAPEKMGDDWDPRFTEALYNLSRTEYLLDLLLFGAPDEKIEMMKDQKNEVTKLEEAVRRINEDAGGGYPDPASGPD